MKKSRRKGSKRQFSAVPVNPLVWIVLVAILVLGVIAYLLATTKITWQQIVLFIYTLVAFGLLIYGLVYMLAQIPRFSNKDEQSEAVKSFLLSLLSAVVGYALVAVALHLPPMQNIKLPF